MAIPAIAPYPMPSTVDIEDRVAWRADPSRAALLIHDMQRYFLAAFQPDQSPMVELLANVRQLRDRCAALGIPVVYSAQPGDQSRRQRGLLWDVWGPGIGADPSQTAIAEELAPDASDTVLTKWRYSAFARTDLAGVLAREGRDQLIICGIYAHIGCLTTANDAFMRDIQPFLVVDAVADFSREDHDMAVRYAARRCAATRTTAGLLAELAAGAA